MRLAHSIFAFLNLVGRGFDLLLSDKMVIDGLTECLRDPFHQLPPWLIAGIEMNSRVDRSGELDAGRRYRFSIYLADNLVRVD